MFKLILLITSVAGMSMADDVFLMAGADVDRPSLSLRANYSIGVGHIEKSLSGFALGDEVTVGYAFESGTNRGGFWYVPSGSFSTVSVGLMKNFGKFHSATFYSWPQIGLTAISESGTRLYVGYGFGIVLHTSKRGSIWIQESYNKVVTVPWYTTTGIGYAIGF